MRKSWLPALDSAGIYDGIIRQQTLLQIQRIQIFSLKGLGFGFLSYTQTCGIKKFDDLAAVVEGYHDFVLILTRLQYH